MITIQPAGPSDAVLIADLSRDTFYETYASQNSIEDMNIFLNEQFSKEMLMAEVGEKGNHFFLAYYENQLAGYVFLKEILPDFLIPERILEISRIYVSNLFIGKGIGKELMQKAIQFSTAKQASSIKVAVWEHNPRAIRFYTSFGFIKSGVRDFLLGKDLQHDWVMHLPLSE